MHTGEWRPGRSLSHVDICNAIFSEHPYKIDHVDLAKCRRRNCQHLAEYDLAGHVETSNFRDSAKLIFIENKQGGSATLPENPTSLQSDAHAPSCTLSNYIFVSLK